MFKKIIDCKKILILCNVGFISDNPQTPETSTRGTTNIKLSIPSIQLDLQHGETHERFFFFFMKKAKNTLCVGGGERGEGRGGFLCI